MSEAFIKIDLHGLRQEEAMKVIDKAIASAGPTTYQLQLIISCAVREEFTDAVRARTLRI